MKKIPLSRGAYAIVDNADFIYLSQWRWYLDAHGYARRSYKQDGKQRTVTMHKVLMVPLGGELIDHKNMNRCDNRRNNLRFCTRSENAMNRQKTIKNIAGYKGVHPERSSRKNPWRAKIQVNGKAIYLGLFPTPESAARAYNEAAKKFHGEFAYLNKKCV